MAADQQITLRLTIGEPVPGVAYSLQNKQGEPVCAVIAGEQPLSFDVQVAVAPGPRFLGDMVRREGPTRRFIYIAIGEQAGDASSPWNRRAKIDIHDLPAKLLEKALAGSVLEALLPGRAADGGPACASVRPLGPWKVVE
ncbi:DUF5990 family protein [Paraburkholderia agricolaris]|uniref:DUF5990 family protein n=1 Tax=Paraburkholderia agricolaris TaxID=2152888 RepID=A0ABW9A0B9_9BURK